MSARAKVYPDYAIEQLICLPPSEKRVTIKDGKDYVTFKDVQRLGGLRVSTFKDEDKEDNPNAIKDCSANVGSYGIIRDPEDPTKFINTKPRIGTREDGSTFERKKDFISDDDFMLSVKHFETADKMDRYLKKCLLKLGIKADSTYKAQVRCSQKAETTVGDPMYVTAHYKLRTFRYEKKPGVFSGGRERPATATSDYDVTFVQHGKELTFEQARAISLNALVSFEWTPTAIYQTTGGWHVQNRISRIDFLEPGTDPNAERKVEDVTDSYIDEYKHLPPAVRASIMRQREEAAKAQAEEAARIEAAAKALLELPPQLEIASHVPPPAAEDPPASGKRAAEASEEASQSKRARREAEEEEGDEISEAEVASEEEM
jgi:hypothetical protein